MESLRRKPILILLCCLLALGFASMVLADDGEPVLGKVKTPGRTTITAPTQGFAVPVNDECPGALVIPDGATNVGDYPVCSPITTDVLEATPPCDTPSPTDPPSCLAAGQHNANTVWYTWTPSVTQFYNVIACAGANCGPGRTTTTPSDGVVVMYTTSDDTCAGTYTQVACNDDGCAGAGPSRIGPIQFNAGQKYFLAAGNWTNTSCATAGQINRYELRIEVATPPANDTCAAPEPLTLGVPAAGGLNGVTNNDYQLSGADCYNQGQIGTTPANQLPGTGRDVVYSFTPAVDGTYSFYAYDIYADSNTFNPTALYLSDSCPVGGAPNILATPPCIQAVNRNADNLASPTGGAERIECIFLTGGQTYYLFVDTTALQPAFVAVTFNVVAQACTNELELNNTPAQADDPQGTGPNSLFGGCPVSGAVYTPNDIDFWWMGTPNAGDRIFMQVDGNGANPGSSSASGVDWDLRLTTATQTIEYDDANNNGRFAGLCPNIAGRPLVGEPMYARVNLKSTTLTAEPYRIFHTVRPSGSGPLGTSATVEPAEPNGAAFIYTDYVYGFAGNDPSTVNDIEFYYFCAKKGDMVLVNLDADPTRDNTPLYSGLFLFSAAGAQLYGMADTFAQGGTSSATDTPGPTLTSTTPFSPAQAIDVPANSTGLWAVAVNGQATAAGNPPSTGDYLVQMSLNCAVPAAEMSITKTGPATVVAGQDVTYTISVSNAGPNLAGLAYFADLLPVGVDLVDYTAPDTWQCFYGAGELDCFEGTGCFEGTAEFTITVHVPQCFGNTTITNLALTGSNTIDPVGDNNLTGWDVIVTDDGTCNDGNVCTLNDMCDGAVCVGGPLNTCDDGNVCTDDSCDPAVMPDGCVHTNNSAPCTDGNICTGDAMGIDICMDGACMPGGANTNPCNDANACTTNDTCANAMCVGGPPPNCNDGNSCTNDSCDPMIGCVNACNHTCNQKGFGWWKRLCRGPHPSGEFISMNDVDCVNNTCTFAAVASPADICAELTQFTHNNKCEQAEAHFMTLLLNICRCRVSGNQMIDSHCGGNDIVGQIVPAIDAVLCDPSRNHSDCVSAICSANQVNDGSSLWANTLKVDRSGNSVNLTWSAPYASPDGLTGTQQPASYRIYRRSDNETAMVQIGQVSGSTTTFVDSSATGTAQFYEVTAMW